MMSRLSLTVLAALAVVQSAAGASLRSEGIAGQGDRRLQAGNCSSIGCPESLTPIPELWEVPCDGDPCEISACCEALCSGYACSDSLTPIMDASKTVCPDLVCSDELCCEAFCSYHACPDGYNLIEDAGVTLCTDQVCTDDQCCTES